MKKVIIAVIFLSMAAAVYSQTGIIREITGEVELKTAGSAVFIRAQNGNEVAQDTIISTGFRSTAVVVIGSSSITIQPLTRLALSEIQSSAGIENLNVNLQAGRIRVDVNPPAGTKVNTTVQSPSATASVRGTSYEMDIYNLNVIEGTVNFVGSDNVPVSVTGGSSTSVTTSGSAQDPILLSSIDVLPPLPPGAGASGEILSVNNIQPPFSAGTLSIILIWQ